ncbi:MAG TPA: CHASE domain-containing protein [Mariprofundaceae bacterium]|nr:CHASE domain-containing protein [Mariprofundaceae bacterium]
MTKTYSNPHISLKNALVVTLIITALAIIAVVSLWGFLKTEERDNLEHHFLADIAEEETKIDERMLAYSQILKGGRGLFQVSQNVTRDEWHNYVSGLNLSDDYPGIQGVGYAALLRPSELKDHEREIRKKGFDNYRIWPEGKRNLYSSIVYLEPFDWRNRRAFGYDMFSEPTRHEAMARARDTGEASLTGKVLLVQETDEKAQAGTLLYVPMYRKGAVIESVQSRRDALIGWIYSPYRMDNLINGILGKETKNIRLHIYDSEKKPDNLLYDSNPNNEDMRMLFEHTLNLEVGGRHWILSFMALPSYADENPVGPFYSQMIGIILIALLLITLAWNVLRTQHTAEGIAQELTSELKNNKDRVDSALNGTIDAVSRMVEARDPYTAGHQARVAALAEAIAGEMGLDDNEIKGIRIGALIHDLGKTQLPAELLSKPGRLSEIEFDLIKSHPSAGYNILKDIDFPWPIAAIAYQHHEREDGSGYPQGLNGDEICIGAKIVGVADVVEAMSSSRPYRPGLGLDAALEEIEAGSGIKYEEKIVSACLKLFRKGMFSFEPDK